MGHRGGGGGGRPPLGTIGCWSVYGFTPTAGGSVQRGRSPGAAPSIRLFEWLSGIGQINHHTCLTFGSHDRALQELFVQVLGLLRGEGLVTLERVMRDGTKIRACAGADSFRREERIAAHLETARQQVQAIGDPTVLATGVGRGPVLKQSKAK